MPPAESPDYSSKNSSQLSLISEQEISPVASVITGSQDETSSQESDLDKEITHEERPTSSKTIKKSWILGYSAGRLQKTMSCKSLVELELEEVKGFMDLGFIFRKGNLNKRMMGLIPGLQRLDAYKIEENGTRVSFEITSNNDDSEDEKKGIMRPYLSEAWLSKIPDSPLLNLRIPRVSTTEDMKKHLKYWARTVASAIQQDS
ncbi:hypothetical protein Pfo_028796 [Paulownia fortunei]|nr:hypothetical protein Pfo_028796 [Paulownia fortunei]